LIRLACANNGGGDPTSAYHADRSALSKTSESTTEKKPATASGVGRMAQWARASTQPQYNDHRNGYFRR